MARDHGHDHEQGEIEDLARPRDEIIIEWRIEEIARPQHAGHGRRQRRNKAKMPAGQQYRQEIDHRAPADIEIVDQAIGNERGRGDHQKGHHNAAQFALESVRPQRWIALSYHDRAKPAWRRLCQEYTLYRQWSLPDCGWAHRPRHRGCSPESRYISIT